jgi:hypothetical protein
MARTVHLACARCGHSQTYVVESAENDEACEAVRDPGDRAIAAADGSTAAELRLRRLELLPRSLPVGGIITPV